MTADEKSEDRFARLKEKLAKEPRNTEEETAAFEAERASMDGTLLEAATMLENGDIAVKTWEYKDGAVGDGWFTLRTDEPGYDECRTRHGLTNPGDSHTIVQKLVEGNWVVQAS